MANTFTRKLSRSIGTSLTSVGSYTVGASTQTTVIGLSLANISNGSLTANVHLHSGGSNYQLIKNAVVPFGGTLIPVGGDQKLVLETNDSLCVSSSGPTDGVDVILSVLEIT